MIIISDLYCIYDNCFIALCFLYWVMLCGFCDAMSGTAQRRVKERKEGSEKVIDESRADSVFCAQLQSADEVHSGGGKGS